MAILAGIKIPDGERVEIALTRIYGIGAATAKRITKEVGIEPKMRVNQMSSEDLANVRAAIDRNHILIEGDLRREVQFAIRRLGDIQSYRGLRHRRHLPVRGQRTKTNARTKRGRRQTVAGKRRVAAGK